ncbi:uncharacterized protein DDB_G0271670 isoform X2 [Anopheles bellator]|uniref:uncharacterized protein DDB_G0271670 isoform X2 n=1 Tax=Anopheles bellator TaxID=139047 RepID=UPI002647DA98|nr:uncharacterized protein DDB_G0271670 isoform X2 [Anopheles bellator]
MGRTAKGNTDEQIGEARNFGLPDMLYDVAARVATTRVGQFAYKRVDNLLWTVEKTARWSLPQSFPPEVGLAATRASAPGDDEDLKGSNISGPPLVRPLPWLLFLPALILLRMIRTTLSVATLAIGRGPVLPSAMVGFLQNKRRKLRALKYRGQRLQRIRKVEREAGLSAAGRQQRATWLERFRALRMLLCSRPYVDANSDVAHAIVFRKDRPVQPKRTAAKKRSLNQREADSDGETGSEHDSCEDANCQELLEKYAHVADDSSFNVEDMTSASETTDSCASEEEPSPKKNNVEKASTAEQHQQNGGQHKGEANKSDLESPAGKTDEPSKVPPSKSMDAANRSKSATGLENSSTAAAAATSSDAKLTSSSSTPSKSIPNLSSSPENNENKPLNQNVHGKSSSSSSSPQSGRRMVAPATKQSPSAAQADGGRSNVHQQQHKPARSQPVTTTMQQQPQQQPSQQYFSNGGKNRPKKPTNQSVA